MYVMMVPEEGEPMRKRFVLEAIMLAIYGELMAPAKPVEYIIPLSTIYELEELKDSIFPRPVSAKKAGKSFDCPVVDCYLSP